MQYTVADRKYPHVAESQERRSRLMGQYLADARVSCRENPSDELLSRSCMETLQELDEPLKRMFAHYACLDILDPHKLGWARVREVRRGRGRERAWGCCDR